MQISQEKKDFAPITLVIETEEEARAVWEVIDVGSNHSENLTPAQQSFLNKLSNWFGSQAKL